MQLMNFAEAAEQLGMKSLETDRVLITQAVTSKTYYLPAAAVDLTIISRSIGEQLTSFGPCCLQITYWSNDSDSNQQLFYGYQKGWGDERLLREASVYRFDREDGPFLASILSLVLYFGWDARIFDTDLTFEIRVNNDGFLDYESVGTRDDPIGLMLSSLRLSELSAT